MACHDVDKVAKCLCRVSVRADVDVNAATVVGVGNRTSVAELPGYLLQVLDVLILEDGRCKLGFLLVPVGADANIARYRPSPALVVKAAPSIVTPSIVAYRVARSEVVCNHFDRLLAGYVSHLDFNADGLLFHAFDLPLCVLHLRCSSLRFFVGVYYL